MNGLVCLLVFGLLAITALAALGLCRRLFSHELPRRMATLALLENPQQWETQCAALAAQLTWTDRDIGRLAGTGMYSVLQPAQGLLLLPSVGVDENFWKRHRL